MKLNFKKFKFNLLEKRDFPTKNICNFYTCLSCHGKQLPDIRERDRLRELNKQKKPRKFINKQNRNYGFIPFTNLTYSLYISHAFLLLISRIPYLHLIYSFYTSHPFLIHIHKFLKDITCISCGNLV